MSRPSSSLSPAKGNHSDSAASAEQLASASAHAEAVRIGPWNETLGLLFSTQLPTDGGTMTVHALQAAGSGGRLFPAEVRAPNLKCPTVPSKRDAGLRPAYRGSGRTGARTGLPRAGEGLVCF